MIFPPDAFPENSLDADIAIIGAGAAGITMAHRLIGTGLRICLIESGDIGLDTEWQDRFRTTSVGHPADLDEGRLRTFGGSTACWTGRCAMLDPEDFSQHAHIADSGWPITYETMLPYYRQAAEYAGFGSGDGDIANDRFDSPSARFDMLRQMFSANEAVQPFLWRFFSESRDYFRHWGDSFNDNLDAARNVTVLLGCDAVGLSEAPNGKDIASLTLRARSGRQISVRAEQFVVAAGGVENSRLLLNWARATPDIFGKVEGSVGRWFMQHPRTQTATIETTPQQASRLQTLLNRFVRNKGLQEETGVTLSAETRRSRYLGNVSAALRYAPNSGILQIGNVLPRILARVQGHEPHLRNPEIALILDLEQQPDRDSRIMLAADKDILGLYAPIVDWRLNDLERKTSAFMTNEMGRWLARHDLGDLRPIADAASDGGLHPEFMLESYHPLGGTRMSDSPQSGVVDADLRVHGIGNLFVCGGSVFPTGGHANPTLTIVALALRLSDHIAAGYSQP